MPDGIADYTQSAPVDHHQPNRTDNNRIVIETPGVIDSSPENVRRAEIINRGGAYHDRIKILPKFGGEPRKQPLPSDSEINQLVRGQRVTT